MPSRNLVYSLIALTAIVFSLIVGNVATSPRAAPVASVGAAAAPLGTEVFVAADIPAASGADIVTTTSSAVALVPGERFPDVIYRVTITLQGTDSVVNVVSKADSNLGTVVPSDISDVAHTEALNSGVALTAGNRYEFDVEAARFDQHGNKLAWNVQLATTSRVEFIRVKEIR